MKVLRPLSNRRQKVAIWDDADRLLEDYQLPGLDSSYLIVLPSVWEILAAIDETQAHLAGPLMWTRDREGIRWRTDESETLGQLARDADELQLTSLADKLRSLSDKLRRWPT